MPAGVNYDHDEAGMALSPGIGLRSLGRHLGGFDRQHFAVRKFHSR
jgi:hypothetical protein